MSDLFEYSDRMTSPVEAFYCNKNTMSLPVENHWHYFVELLYMIEGNVFITCNENTYHLTPGMMIMIPPQAIHSVYSEDGQDFNYSCIKFNTNRIQMIEGYLPNLNIQFHEILQMQNPPLIFTEDSFPDIGLQSTLDNLINEVRQKNYGYNTYIYSILSSLMLRILRIWYDMGIPMNTEPLTDTDTYAIQDVILYIDKHSNENINIPQLASMCNMSYSYFAKVFHRQFGQSCKQYIEFIRLSKAENLILFTDYDLTTIAEETGFADCSHLIRCFKKRFSLTPKQYRLQHRTI
ncbi:MAG: AraC family transcriptional regulator [Eubacterium sp.]|nr:AraC family transcriptional regulator [Eubacterium sp.]